MDAIHQIMIAVGLGILVVAAWCAIFFGVLGVISKLGWSGFADYFRLQGDAPEGPAFTVRQARFEIWLASYNNAMRAKFSERGIFLLPVFIVRVFHPPLLIPWQHVKSVVRAKLWLGSFAQINIEAPPGKLTLYLTDKAAESRLAELGHPIREAA